MQLSVTRCLSLDATLTTGGRIVSLKDTLTGTVTGYTVYHHVTDHLGSFRAVVYAGRTAPSAQQGISPGTVVETSDYLPFGTRWTQTGGSSTSTLTDPKNRWRYYARKNRFIDAHGSNRNTLSCMKQNRNCQITDQSIKV